ncbi:MAG: 1,2-phenylacetyl-CoA epoxidase subunit PaaC [Pseudomonadota bacterium]
MNDSHFRYVLRLGDDALILGQRLSQWCGHSPFLEEDIALANTALDHVGRARMLLTRAGELEGVGRDEDALAYFRDERDYTNCLIAELPVGDFAFTMVRQFLCDVFHHELYGALMRSTDEQLAGIAQKSVKESAYHVKRSSEWVKRLGDGTEESHQRAQDALEEVWAFANELFEVDDTIADAIEIGVAADLAPIEARWQERVGETLRTATLATPEQAWPQTGGRQGLHTEHMGRLLAEMQSVQRAYPGNQW